jgi:hypothetical protein
VTLAPYAQNIRHKDDNHALPSALDYFRACDAPRDERMNDTIKLLLKKQKKDGI